MKAKRLRKNEAVRALPKGARRSNVIAVTIYCDKCERETDIAVIKVGDFARKYMPNRDSRVSLISNGAEILLHPEDLVCPCRAGQSSCQPAGGGLQPRSIPIQ